MLIWVWFAMMIFGLEFISLIYFINFSGTAFVRCPICDDHVLNEYLGRHIILNHPEENPREDDNDNDVSEEGKDEFCEKDDELENEQSKQKKIASCPECKVRKSNINIRNQHYYFVIKISDWNGERCSNKPLPNQAQGFIQAMPNMWKVHQ